MQRHRGGLAADVAGDDATPRRTRPSRGRCRAARRRGAPSARSAGSRGRRSASRRRRGSAPPPPRRGPAPASAGSARGRRRGRSRTSSRARCPARAKTIGHAVRRQPGAEPALRAEQQHEDEARDHRRDRERQVDEGDQERLAGKSNLAIAQAAARPKTAVERHGDGGDDQRQPDRGERVGLRRGVARTRPRPRRNASVKTASSGTARPAAARTARRRQPGDRGAGREANPWAESRLMPIPSCSASHQRQRWSRLSSEQQRRTRRQQHGPGRWRRRRHSRTPRAG